MIEEMRRLLERFPEDEQTIGELLQKDEAFRSMCQEYHHIDSELGWVMLIILSRIFIKVALPG